MSRPSVGCGCVVGARGHVGVWRVVHWAWRALTAYLQPFTNPIPNHSQLRTYHEVIDEIYSKVTNVGALSAH